MDEAKARIDVIDRAKNGQFNLHPMLIQEFCYLQLRLLCEVIALGCLVAHGDITEIDLKPLSKKYDADTIIKKLEPLHPEFYPRPVIMTIVPNISVDIEEKKDGYLTKQELLSLYGKAGTYVHRGVLNKIESRPPYTPVDLSEVVRYTQRIFTLLNTHQIVSPDKKKRLLVTLRNPADHDQVQVAFAQAP
jgi:hypothetical protein